jgi:hypothetical protein
MNLYDAYSPLLGGSKALRKVCVTWVTKMDRSCTAASRSGIRQAKKEKSGLNIAKRSSTLLFLGTCPRASVIRSVGATLAVRQVTKGYSHCFILF